ncbi:MAG: MaoC family dehydratase N-terminal domain-containing protein [Rhodobacter sp.]|nr:MaoC family dehydratase N-terminal domain-containing protein [Rhodobacter sp.]
MTDWIGHTRTGTEAITPRLLATFRATLGNTLVSAPVPLGLHWALLPDMAAPEDLGPDGHPRLGLYLPDLGLPRRMWAGGEILFQNALSPDERVTRTSTITDIRQKTGSSGALAFVTVAHTLTADGATRITERQDIVYREPPSGPVATPAPAPDWPDASVLHITPDTVLLQRYSALTFNSHRIHYDLPYATGVEGYPALVVHGPLQAIWLMNHAARDRGPPATFAYRGTFALTLGHSVTVESHETPTGLDLRIRRADGVVTMQAAATFP